ncbi:MAG: hypothetical protein OXL98_17125, partial [Acidimicrobiaceae bacterium]|nr:hypothetical protein [Acidimicrobiaceae bacterium]
MAVTLSAIWPGLGHVGHRNRRAAVLAAAALVAAAAGIGYAYRRDMRDLLALAVSRTSLLAVILVSGGLLAARGAVAFDAYRVARRRYPRRRAGGLRRAGAAATLAVLAVLIAAPHLWVARLATAQLTLLAEVFDASDTPSARPTPLPAGSPSRQPDPAGTGPVASVRADRGGTAQPPAAAPAEGGDGLPGGAADGPDSPAGAAPATKIGPEDGSGVGAGASTSTDAATTATDATGRLTTTATDGTAT